MSKSEKGKTARIILSVVGGTTIFMGGAAAVLYFVPDMIDSTEQTKEQNKIKEEIENLVPDKDPEQIVIPEDATPEEKEEIQKEIEYWSVVKAFKEKLAKSDELGQIYNVVEIKSIFSYNGYLFFDTSAYLFNDDKDYEKVFARLFLQCNDKIDSCEDLLNYLMSSEESFKFDYASQELTDVQRYKNCIDIVKGNTEFLQGVESYEIYGIDSESPRDREFDMPVWFSAFIKCKYNDGSTKVIRTTFGLSDGKYEKTNEGVEQYYKEGKYYFYDTIIYDELGFDWEELNEEYKLNDFQVGKQQSEQTESAEAEAQAASSNKFTNADGTKNYAGYVEDKGATKVKTTQQNPQVVEMNLGL